MTHNKRNAKKEREAREERRGWENSIKDGYEVIAALMAISPDIGRPITAEDLPSSSQPYLDYVNTLRGRQDLKAWQQLFDDIVHDVGEHIAKLPILTPEALKHTLDTVEVTARSLEIRMQKATKL